MICNIVESRTGYGRQDTIFRICTEKLQNINLTDNTKDWEKFYDEKNYYLCFITSRNMYFKPRVRATKSHVFLRNYHKEPI
jgi:hypothetical protein